MSPDAVRRIFDCWFRGRALGDAALALFGVVVLSALPVGGPGRAEVVRMEVLSRTPFADGGTIGATGPYEKIVGRLHYAVDPDNAANRRIVDLGLAPLDRRGRVTFSGDFVLLKPVDPSRGNHRLLYEVNNRGNLLMLHFFNEAAWSNAPRSPAHAGSGFLMKEGYTLLWSAWNWDVLPGNDRLQIDLPVATDGRHPITGRVAAEIAVDRPSAVRPVAWGQSLGYPPADPDEPTARLTVRARPQAARRTIPRDRWRFVRSTDGGVATDPVRIALDGGFRPGLIYELVYRARDPRVVGLGLAAVRDSLSFFRFAEADSVGNPNPLLVDRGGGKAPDPQLAIIFGISQAGRFIQHMLMEALHLDERGRPVFDAALIHVAGGGKGSFNHRFAQTTRHPSHYEDHLYPADVFPFATTLQRDPVTGAVGSVLDRARGAGAIPHLFYVSTSTEYWTRSASLLHTDVEGLRDLPLDARARLYFIAGAQHGNTARPNRGMFLSCGNPLDHRPVGRALLIALDRWATAGKPPPPSVYPRIADGTLGSVEAYRRAFPAIPSLRLPPGNLRPPRLDLGPRFAARGLADRQPAGRGPAFVTLVPMPDADGLDRGGIRLPAAAVPLGSHLGWNLRRVEFGGPDRLGRWEGSFLPFPLTEADRRAAGDPRRSIAARYRSRERFLALRKAAAEILVRRGFLLAGDIPTLVARAGRAFDAVTRRGGDDSCRYLAEW